ncbi:MULTISPECIES: branched-chain amino acid transport system II carrier protein [unclassified Enterococcus]|uniref:branched-chain amino acid transport system II carrier protein n=1 Tax=unclassified Enterococcus TaxID=2608891 RepID=UPI0015525FFC|nr:MULTISPECIES: branched-chain amino acid transport system II carrier protein [unclassified Enterococcus]MBS7578337.1 branched-chain amino acid transport system II carrier protein [Enterococcus sp. MMGLQ5-2]MBS7585574.1 branched-chain amino acid transport system II carrier protein [Enterococcus sp. MMGLQ5-1]NPD13433.1 branched-chain amino acid transport system II carrier protein [Enterococcus sp. MMGLQ5-1]NPD38168.1 branched-chain amino acid transport system II carrier protein [Enterococcus sp
MEKKLSFKQYLYVGSMLFGLFFGAGNLIFPVHMGQEAGGNIFLANLGFLTTGIGLPFLGIIAIGVSRCNGLFELAASINRRYALIFTVLLYLVIGPFFALPRLATTSYEIGLATFVPESLNAFFLFFFSILFFGLAWFLSRKPSKLLDYVGKFLNPLFLGLLGILLIFAFVRPMGDIATAHVSVNYQSHAFITGFTNGYNTLDALASLAFGIIIVTTIKNMGVEKTSSIAKDTILSGSISIIVMGIIYTLLSYVGAMSLGQFTISENGGIALAQIANHYLGNIGSILLAIIVILACLKTAIGLISAFSETFATLFPKRSYAFFIAISSILPAIFANFGLTKIISFSLPVLMFIYPLAITLIILSIISPLFRHQAIVFQMTTYFTLVAAILDGLAASPDFIKGIGLVHLILAAARDYLPFFEIGLGWLTPATLGFFLGIILAAAKGDMTKKQKLA